MILENSWRKFFIICKDPNLQKISTENNIFLDYFQTTADNLLLPLKKNFFDKFFEIKNKKLIRIVPENIDQKQSKKN